MFRLRAFAVMSVVLLGAMAAESSAAHAAHPARKKDYPCAGCLYDPVDVSASAAPAPLLVVLHGDLQEPSAVAERWTKAAAAHGVALFVPRCPKDRGCAGKWWAWTGEARWIDRQVEAIAEQHPVDPRRTFITGFSGGASFLGYRLAELSDRYAAVGIQGGGIAPSTTVCPTTKRPVHFLVGDANPLHSMAKELRAYCDACALPVTWELLPKANHEAEWKALGTRANELLEWFLAHSRPEPAPLAISGAPDAAPPMLATSSPTTSATPATPAAPATPARVNAEPTHRPPRVAPTHCGCGIPTTAPRSALIAALALAGTPYLRRYARRRERVPHR